MNAIRTIGYEKTDPDRFVAALKEAGVDLLVDVRMVAFSHKPGFSQTPLRAMMEAEGIGYEHVKDLGNPKAGRDAAKSGDHEGFRRIYSTRMATPAAVEAIAALVEKSKTRNLCMMCFERSHTDCHRGIVAESMRCLGVEIVHLSPRLMDPPKSSKSSKSRRKLSEPDELPQDAASQNKTSQGSLF